MSQRGDDRGCNVAYSAFRAWFRFRLSDAGRHDGSYVVVAHRFIGVREDDFPILWMFDHAGLEIVAHRPRGNAAEVFIHMDVASDPGIHLHVERGFDIGIAAVGQTRYEEVYLDLLAVLPDDLHRRTAPVHLAALSGLVLKVTADGCFGTVLVVVVAELRFTDRDVALGDAFFPVLRRISTLDEAMEKEAAIKNIEDTAEQVLRLISSIRL